MNYLLPGLYVLGLYGAYMAGFSYVRTRPTSESSSSKAVTFRFPRITPFLLVVVGIPSILQFFFADLLLLLRRDPTRFLQGEWWRLVTALFVQDGGVAGTIFNLVSLVFVGFAAEQFWDSGEMLLIFFSGGILSQLVAFAWQPIGAGNSVANFSLAGSLAVTCLMRRPSRLVQISALVALGADVLLVFLRDIHGPAALMGAILAFVLNQMAKRKLALKDVE